MPTAGCVAKTVLAVLPDGEVVKVSLAAGPVVMVRLVLLAISAPEVAVSVYVPDLSMLQPEKVAMPEVAVTGLTAQVKVAPAGVAMVSVTRAALTATLLPLTSWTVTAGCEAKETPPAAPDGFVVNASLVAGPVTFQLFPFIEVRALNAAVACPRGAIANTPPAISTTRATAVGPEAALTQLNTGATGFPSGRA